LLAKHAAFDRRWKREVDFPHLDAHPLTPLWSEGVEWAR
jgi:hypothetical protein